MATCGLGTLDRQHSSPITDVLHGSGNRWLPALSPWRPQLVAGHKVRRGFIKGAKPNLDLAVLVVSAKQGRTAGWTEVTMVRRSRPVSSLARDGHLASVPNGEGHERSPPVSLRHIRQWQSPARLGSPRSSIRTLPQLQPPRRSVSLTLTSSRSPSRA